MFIITIYFLFLLQIFFQVSFYFNLDTTSTQVSNQAILLATYDLM